ncbi:MAG: hypothetical protein ABI365_09950 [Lysobacteraceae bacterium]
MSRSMLFASVLALGLASATLCAAPKSVTSKVKIQVTADAHSEGRVYPLNATSKNTRAATIASSSSSASTLAAPTVNQVGDPDTFGRNMIWDGVLSSGTITFANDCTPAPGDPPLGPDDRCVTMNPAPATTTFDLPDIGRMWLPAKASKNILCHWLSINGVYSLYNGTGISTDGRILLTPYLRIESSVLNDPSLIDPSTGLPYGGVLQTTPGTTYRKMLTLAPNARDTESMSDSRVCIAGAVSRQGLIQGFGFTDVQVDNFFKNPMTIKFGVRGSAKLLDFASLIYGLRIIGD